MVDEVDAHVPCGGHQFTDLLVALLCVSHQAEHHVGCSNGGGREGECLHGAHLLRLSGWRRRRRVPGMHRVICRIWYSSTPCRNRRTYRCFQPAPTRESTTDIYSELS